MEGILFAMAVLLMFSGFFSGSETALFSLPMELTSSFSKKGSLFQRSMAKLLLDPGATLATILLGNLAVNVLYFNLACSALYFFESPLIQGAVSVAFLVVILIFGEIVPKSLALAAPLGFSRLAAIPLAAGHVLLYPLCRIMTLLVNRILRFFPGSDPSARLLSPGEMARVIQGRAAWFGLDSRTATLLGEVMELEELRIQDVMIPRVDLPLFDIDDGIDALRERMVVSQLAWILIYRSSPDNTLGIVTARKMSLEDEGKSLIDRIAKLPVVPEVAPLEGALTTLTKSSSEWALVVDEYGGLAGLLTFEQLAEEIVGELSEEYENPGDEIRYLGKGVWHLEGALGLKEWAETFDVKLDLPPQVGTIGGLITFLLDRIPKTGDKVNYSRFDFKVLQARKRRVLLVEIEEVGK